MNIRIDLNLDSINAAVREVEDYEKALGRRVEELRDRLGAIGYEIAVEQFGSAMYDGTNDVYVDLSKDRNRLIIRADGEAVLFIEFGTGVRNPEHPMQGEVSGVVGHGQYGYGLGRLESWRYPMEHGAGTGGEPDPKHPGYYITHGNPANMAMYNAAQDMRKQVLQIAREVFQI